MCETGGHAGSVLYGGSSRRTDVGASHQYVYSKWLLRMRRISPVQQVAESCGHQTQ